MNSVDPLRVNVLEPFCKGSHEAWIGGLERHSRHLIVAETLPGVHWKWRMSHSAQTFAARLTRDDIRPDVILCTSMTEAAALRGLLPLDLAAVPLAVMFHENQLTYPLAAGEIRDLHYAWAHVVTGLAADAVLFNSAFHREDFLTALTPFLRGFPDFAPLHAVEEIREKSRVVHPGVERERFLAAGRAARREGPLRILWSHRWEADKDPDLFLEVLGELAGEPFELVLAGPGADEPGPAQAALCDRLGSHLIRRGFIPAGEFADVVASCDLVASTARHDFYGIGVVEAMTAGLCPLLPNRQNYPALVPAPLHPACLYEDRRGLRERLLGHIRNPLEARRIGTLLPETLVEHDVRRTAAQLDDLLAALAGGRGDRCDAG